MEGEEGGGMKLSKRFSDDKGGGEVDYKTKSGTAWSHNFLNQKPWHPLSYPNQRRKWIAEQTHAHRERHAEEVAREYAKEQEFYRQTSLISKKEKEKVELMQAVSFMYVRPPGFNAESAKAAEMDDQRKKEEMVNQQSNADGLSVSLPPSSSHLNQEKKKSRPKDVFGRRLPTEEEFEILKNAPRLETGVPARAKPFGVELRNVKCLRCGNYGHQSGDRECPLKDAIMPNEESRLKRDDPLNAILAHTDLTEPLKWELKQKPGISPPRGGFKPDDPNQQIVADDIFDEYGGFLSMGDIPDLLANFSKKPKKTKKKKHKKKQLVHSESEASSDDGESRSKKKKVKANKKKGDHAKSSSSDTPVSEKDHGKSRHKHSEDSDSDRNHQSRKTKQNSSFLPKDNDPPRHGRSKHGKVRHSFSSEESDPNHYDGSHKNNKRVYSNEDSDSDRDDQGRKYRQKHKKHSRKRHSYSSEESDPDRYDGSHKNSDKQLYSNEDSDSNRDDQGRKYRQKHKKLSRKRQESDPNRYDASHKNSDKQLYSNEDSDSDRDDQGRKYRQKHKKHSRKRHSYSSEDSGPGGGHASNKSRDEHTCKSDDHQRQPLDKRSSHKYSSKTHPNSQRHKRNDNFDRYRGSQKSKAEHSYSSEDSDVHKYGQSRSEKSRNEHSYSFDNSDHREKHHEPRRSSHKH